MVWYTYLNFLNSANEIVNNIINKSFFEANAVMIRTSDEMLGTVVNLKA